MSKDVCKISIDDAIDKMKKGNLEDMQTVVCKGFKWFVNGVDSIKVATTELKDLVEEACQYYEPDSEQYKMMKSIQENEASVIVYHFMSGQSFLKHVQAGGFNDNDGSLSDIILDGYITNLGLCENGIMQGKFLCDAESFAELCEEHEVIVNWANK